MKIEQVIEEFKKYLEQNSIIIPSDDRNIDLYSFYKSLTELKTYVNRNAKHMQSTLVSFQEALFMIDRQIKLQDGMRKSSLTYQDNEIERVRNAFSSQLISYRDSILRNYLESKGLAKKINNFWVRPSVKKKTLGLLEGLKFTLEKIDGELYKNGVQKIKTIGLTYDPEIMKIIKVISDKNNENLIVLEESVSGFYNSKTEEIIRYAEVIVNKIK